MNTAPRFWRAPNGVILEPPEAGLEAVWWRCGATARAAGQSMDWAADALGYLIEAGQAGWDAMDARLRQAERGGDPKTLPAKRETDGKVPENHEPNQRKQQGGGTTAQRSIFE